MSKKNEIVSGEEVELLSEYKHARLRTEMYLGSREVNQQTIMAYDDNGRPIVREYEWVPALFTAYREIFDNAADEVVAHGHGDRIDVTFDPETLRMSITDNGRGIPITLHSKTGQHQATVALTVTKAGRNFNDDERGSTRGLNGVGASIVNMVSKGFSVTIHRDGKKFVQTFEQADEHKINKPKITDYSGPKRGTHIEFTPSAEVFRNMVLPEDFIKDRVYEAALCYPGIKIYLNGKQVKTKGIEKGLFAGQKPIEISISNEKMKSRFWLIPQFNEDGGETLHSMVNAIPMFNGGTHMDAFRRYFYSGMIKALERESKRRKLQPNRSDISDGLLIYNITDLDGAQFDSQSKTRVINDDVGVTIRKELEDEEFYKKLIRRHGDWINAIYERCANRTMKSDAAELNKMIKSSKKVRVEKLKDASSKDRSSCKLLLAEGDSAAGSITEGRDPAIHAIMPLRGKVLNTHGMAPKAAYSNDELARIMTVVGLVPGQKAKRENLRYGAIYLTTDADQDGLNIAALLVNFFYTYWPELFDPEDPFIYVFHTPLIIAKKGKQAKYWYNDDYDDFSSEAYSGWDITRAKGLAALKKADWQHVLAQPKLTSIVDDGELEASLDLIFNPKKAEARKEWIGI